MKAQAGPRRGSEAISRRALVGLSVLSGATILAGTSVRSQPVTADVTSRERATMGEMAADFMQSYDVPGLSVAVFHAGMPIYDVAYGFADKDSGELLTAKHRFRICSITKPITSAGIFLLIEEGRVGLDSRVFGSNSVFGTDFPSTKSGPFLESVTVEHLLTHTAGGWPNDSMDPMFLNPGMSHRELIEWTLQNVWLQFPPGQHYAYSNFGYCLLGRVIEKITGQTYVQYIESRILRPFGLTGMRIAGNSLAERASDEVRYYGQGGQNPYGMNVARMDSHGGWIGTPSELAKFATCIDGFADTPQLLTRDALATMTTPSSANPHYAKGLMVNAQANWWHTGSLPGTLTIMVRTHTNYCWAAFANTRSRRPQMSLDLDKLIWRMVRSVNGWHA